MATKRKLITCRKCDGKGKIFLSPKLQTVFDAIKHHKGSTTIEIAGVVKGLEGLHATAINQRLDELMAMDLIERTRSGRGFQYFVKSHKGK